MRTAAGLASIALAATVGVSGASAAPNESSSPSVDVIQRQGSDGITVLSGDSASGSVWEARVPDDWNGTVVLYAHGFRGPGPNEAWDPNMDPTFNELMDRGYAVLASSYSTVLWALGTATDDQLDALAQFSAGFAEPSRTIAFGRSMGGLVTSLIAERPASGVDGAVPMCGLMQGGTGLLNYQLDAAHAAAELLVGDSDLRLTGFWSPAEAADTIAALTQALEEAKETPEGRARIALVGLFLHTPTHIEGVDSKDHEALAAAQVPLITATLTEVISRRSGVVPYAGGDPGWTVGNDYAAMFRTSGQHQAVRHLYRQAGLDLQGDLDRLTRTADIAPDEDALAWMERTSQPTGDLQIPVFSTHTVHDLLAPVEGQEDYADTVRRAGNQSLLRQAYTSSTGHCSYTVAENIAAIEVMADRLDTGHWPNTTPRALTRRSASLGESSWLSYRPDRFVADRTWAGAE